MLPLAEDSRAVQEIFPEGAAQESCLEGAAQDACLEGATQEVFPEGATQEVFPEGATPGPVEPVEVTGAGELPGSVATDAYEEEEASFRERLHDRVSQKNDARCKELSGIMGSPVEDARFPQEEAASSSSDVLVVYEDQRGLWRQGPTEAEEELPNDGWGHRADEIDWSPISTGEGEASELLEARRDEPSEQAGSSFRPPDSDEVKISNLIAEVCSCMANGGSLLELNRLLERSHRSLSWKKINVACRKLGLHLCTREFLGQEKLREGLAAVPWSRAPMSLLRNHELRAVRRAFCVRVNRPAWPAWY